MARVTIEDCVEKVGSHFKVVQIASHRAHQLELGAKPMVEKENDKPVVIALREIAEGKIDEKELSRPLIEKEAWEQKDGLLIQPNDLGKSVADTENYSDMNKIEGDDTTVAQNNVEASQKLNPKANEEPKTDKV